MYLVHQIYLNEQLVKRDWYQVWKIFWFNKVELPLIFLLLRNGKISSKFLFGIKHPSEHSVRTADDNNKFTLQAF